MTQLDSDMQQMAEETVGTKPDLQGQKYLVCRIEALQSMGNDITKNRSMPSRLSTVLMCISREVRIAELRISHIVTSSRGPKEIRYLLKLIS